MKVKLFLIFLNVVCAIALFVLGDVVSISQKVASYSLYREFIARGVVDENVLAEKGYDMPTRLQIFTDKSKMRTVSVPAAMICLLNAVLVSMIPVARKANQSVGLK